MMPRDARPDADQALDELRRILVGPELDVAQRVEQVEHRIDDPRTRSEDVSQVLPQALLARKDDPALAHAMEKPVAAAIGKTVRRDPKPLVEAIFPVIGPAIRRSIAHAMRQMVEQFNAALENSLSPKSLLWRLEARRTGRSFAEVVLLKTLVYRVEQVFLIRRESGILLRHVTAPDVEARDANLVSAMLTATQDFVRDSFSAGPEDAVETLQVGEFAVWVAQGRQAVVAAVIRGSPPAELRKGLQEAVDTVERDMATELGDFDGDTAPFEACEPALEACLGQATARKKSSLLPALVFALALAGVLWMGYGFLEGLVAQRRWEAYLERIEEEPGLVVTASGKRDGRFFLRGLRDPLARDPADLLGDLDAGTIAVNWELYVALDPALVLKRVVQAMEPPSTARLRLDGTVLIVTGEAPAAWSRRLERDGPLLPGVTRVDTSGLAEVER